MVVVRAGACLLVKTRYRFQVVVHHIGRSAVENFERLVHAPAEIGHQHFDARLRRKFTDGADAFDKMPGPAVAQIVAVDAGDDHIREPQRGDCLRQVQRLLGVERVGSAVTDIAERAAPCALVAHDHEGRRALAEAFPDIGAGRFLTNRVKAVFPEDLLDFGEARIVRGRTHADPVGFLELFRRHDLDRDACRLGLAFLFGVCAAHWRCWITLAASRSPIFAVPAVMPRSRACVTRSPGKPHGSMAEKGARSMSTLREMPW